MNPTIKEGAGRLPTAEVQRDLFAVTGRRETGLVSSKRTRSPLAYTLKLEEFYYPASGCQLNTQTPDLSA